MLTTRPEPGGAGAPGRVVAPLVAFAGVSLVGLFLAPALLHVFLPSAPVLTSARLIAYGTISSAVMLVGTALTLRWFREPWAAATRMGAGQAGQWKLFGGLAAGWFAMAIPAGVLVWTGAMRIVPGEPGNWGEAAATALAVLAPAALTEELTFRGYGLTLLQRAWGTRAAVAVSSVAFGLVHLLNPGVSLQAVFMIALAGSFLAVVRLSFDSLWSAWLAHFAYNFVQVAVFHTAVSGISLPQPGYRAVATGPEWLTGGAWGPEAGAAAAIGMLVISFLLSVRSGWVRIHRRGWRLAIDVRPAGRREP